MVKGKSKARLHYKGKPRKKRTIRTTSKSKTGNISREIRKGWPTRFVSNSLEVVVGYEETDDFTKKVSENIHHHSVKSTVMKSQMIKVDKDGNEIWNPEIEGELKHKRIPTYRTVLHHHLPINFEFCDYVFHLSTLAQRLFFYLISFEVDVFTNLFGYNKKVRYEFNQYCNMMNGSIDAEPYKERSIQNALAQLTKYNLVVNVSKGRYMVNPMVLNLGGQTDNTLRLNDYANILIKKRKHVALHLVPVIP